MQHGRVSLMHTAVKVKLYYFDYGRVKYHGLNRLQSGLEHDFSTFFGRETILWLMDNRSPFPQCSTLLHFYR